MTRLRPLAAAAVAIVLGGVAWPNRGAAGEADAARLFDVLRMSEMVGILREEGLGFAAETGADVFADAPPAGWQGAVEEVLDAGEIEAQLRAALDAATAGMELGPVIDFFSAEPGQTFIDIELAAHRALVDDEVEQMAREAAAMAMVDEGPLFRLIGQFVAVNDLVDKNAVAAMNSGLAFNRGLMAGGGFPAGVTEDDILDDLWAQEPQIRADAEERVYSLLLLAYGPVPLADIEALIAFSETEAGRVANRAVSAALNEVADGISFDLGRMMGRFLANEEL